MFEIKDVEHHIQKHILAYLMEHKYARFRDMRPPKCDTNLYSYHLKLLEKRRFINKTSEGYTLGVRGALYVDRINADTVKLTPQPKIITMTVIQDGYGGVLMYKKLRQPFIDRWTVPFGKVHNNDISITEAAKREVSEKVGDIDIELMHAGDCYVRIKHEDNVIISTLVHVFYGQTESSVANTAFEWVPPHKISSYHTAPAIEKIITRTYFKDDHFFEEFTEAW